MRVYFDHASSTPLIPEVKEEMKRIIDTIHGNPSSIHLHGRQSRIVIEEARKIIAQGINASTGEIFFTAGATEANNMTLLGAINDLGVKRIISSVTEHHCILHCLDYIREKNLAEVVVLDVDETGRIAHAQLEDLLKTSSDKTLVSLMHVNNELGTITDIESLATLCASHGALFHSDTAQSLCKLPIDVSTSPINFLCGVAHKFFGPKSVGFIYIKNENMIKPMFHGGGQERGLRSGTENIYGIAGMATAYKLAMDQMEERKEKIGAIKEYFKSRLLNELEDIRINGDDNCLYNILSVSFPQTEKSEMFMMNLDIAGIAASGGSACSSGVENDSHVLQAIGHDPARKTVRFSFSHFNSMEEVDYVVEKLKTITPVSATALTS